MRIYRRLQLLISRHLLPDLENTQRFQALHELNSSERNEKGHYWGLCDTAEFAVFASDHPVSSRFRLSSDVSTATRNFEVPALRYDRNTYSRSYRRILYRHHWCTRKALRAQKRFGIRRCIAKGTRSCEWKLHGIGRQTRDGDRSFTVIVTSFEANFGRRVWWNAVIIALSR